MYLSKNRLDLRLNRGLPIVIEHQAIEQAKVGVEALTEKAPKVCIFGLDPGLYRHILVISSIPLIITSFHSLTPKHCM